MVQIVSREDGSDHGLFAMQRVRESQFHEMRLLTVTR
jgi:hypothetical protein